MISDRESSIRAEQMESLSRHAAAKPTHRSTGPHVGLNAGQYPTGAGRHPDLTEMADATPPGSR